MAFEVCQPNQRGTRLGPDEIGIQKNGFSIASFLKRIGPTDGISVAFDRVARIIRLTPCPRHAGGFALSKVGQVNCRRFFSQFGITERGPVRAHFKDGHLYVHLGPAFVTATAAAEAEDLVA